MKQKILFVSHCFLNDGAKLKNQNLSEMEQEERIFEKNFRCWSGDYSTSVSGVYFIRGKSLGTCGISV